MTFDFYVYRFTFLAREAVSFPAGAPGNIVRGALGSALRSTACVAECISGREPRNCELRRQCAYARMFEPASLGRGPSGLADWPRPFVLRATHLNGCIIEPGQRFWLGVNFFDTRNPVAQQLEDAFRELARNGLGPGRGRAELLAVEQLDQKGEATSGPPISITLNEGRPAAHRLRIAFRTPTELKSNNTLVKRPEFSVLFARARDRVSTLGSLYGTGPLAIDFQPMGERAKAVQISGCELRQIELRRRSSRTGQVHGIGGFVGWAQYEGDLGEFVPILEAAQWTGVGRHCVWGNGELRIEAIEHI